MGSTTSANNLFEMLHLLFDAKSTRDNDKFTIYKLAKALNMPHSMLVKLMHQDINKRVLNPRIETLNKIVTFFNQDGFDIKIDDLINGTVGDVVNISNTTLTQSKYKHTVPVYSMHKYAPGILETEAPKKVKIELDYAINDIFAFESNTYIKPMFQPGSLFFIDRTAKVTANSIIAFTQIGTKTQLKLGKTSNNLHSVCSISDENCCINMKEVILIGMVIHIDAKIL